jgi:hypothetical protein
MGNNMNNITISQPVSVRKNELVYSGRCDAGMTASKTAIYSKDLANYSNDYFNNLFYLQVLKNNDNLSAAPVSEIRKITDYSSTGMFVCDAFSADVEEYDEISVFHESLIAIGRNDSNNVFDSSLVVANYNGSILEILKSLTPDSGSANIPQFTGVIYYVDADQTDDSEDGRSPATAKKTITAAIAAAAGGDAITIKAGVYDENVVVPTGKDGLELWGEIGSIIDPDSGVALLSKSPYYR